MDVSFDPAKRLKNLQKHDLDFADAAQIFDGPIFTREDDRFDYPEPRFQTFGLVNDRLVILVWTPTAEGMRVISMRKCNDREQKAYARRLE